MNDLNRLKEFIKKRPGKTGAFLAAFVLLAACAALGEGRFARGGRRAPSVALGVTVGANDQSQDGAAQSQDGTVQSQDETAQSQKARLTPSQASLLRSIGERMEQMDFLGAASLMEKKQEQLQSIFFGQLGGELYLFDGQEAKAQLEGKGLVLKRATTVFYGTFSQGKPRGEVSALQTIQLDAPRYDYSSGRWKDGKMEGFGISGYDYYEGVEAPEVKEVEKLGNFSQDLLDGDMVYASTDADGNTSTWHFSVDQGVTRIDSRWIFDQENRAYSLLSGPDGKNAYVISQDTAKQAYWKNMIPWEN